MLAFVVPDSDAMNGLKDGVRRFLAWRSIKDDSEDLNLDATQNRETDNNLVRSNETVDSRIKEAYCWLLVPYIDRAVNMKTVVWDAIRISGGTDSIVSKAAKKMVQNEALITKWAPALLLMEMDNILWKDSNNICIKKLWDYLCTYCYLPRLAGYSVLEETIRTGLNSTEYFALAAGISENRFLDLRYNQYVGMINRSEYLVKIVDALKQLAAPKEPKQPVQPDIFTPADPFIPANPAAGGGEKPKEPTPVVQPQVQKNKHFFMSAQLDNTRINRDVQRLVEEVIQHLTALDGCEVEISLEVNATAKDGFPQPTVRTVSENCRTLRVDNFGFDE